jgi:hypothetical protein
MECGKTFEITGFGSTTKLPPGAATIDWGALTALAIKDAIELANQSCDANSCPAALLAIISMTYLPNRGGLEALIRAKCTTGAKPLDPGGAYTADCGSTVEITAEGSGDTLQAAETNAKDNAAAVAKKVCPTGCPPAELETPPPRIRILQRKEQGMSSWQVLYTAKFECRKP